MRLFSPSTTLTLTSTVSPGWTSGISLPAVSFVTCSCSNCWIRFMGSLRRQRQFFKAQGLRAKSLSAKSLKGQSLAGCAGRACFYDKDCPLSPCRHGLANQALKRPILEVWERWAGLGGTVAGPENCHGTDRLSVGIAQKDEPPGKPHDCPVPAQDRDVGRRVLVLRPPIGDSCAEASPVALAIVRGHDQVEGLANGRLGVMAEQAFGARAEQADNAISVSEDDRVAVHSRVIVSVEIVHVVLPKVRAALPGEPFSLGLSPGFDAGVIAAQEHIGDDAAFELLRPRIVGIFQEPLRKAFFGGRDILAHDAREEPHAGIDQAEGRDLAAGEHVVADRDFLEPARFDHALVNALEAAAQNERTGTVRERFDARLRQRRAARAHQQARTPVVGRKCRVDRARNDVGLHHHAGAAAGRRIIDGAVAVARPVANVERIEPPDAGRERLAGEAQAERPWKHLREDGQDGCVPHRFGSCLLPVAAQSLNTPSGGSMTMRRPATSTTGTVVVVNGSITVSGRPSCRSSRISPAPKSWIATTVPSARPSLVTAASPIRSA